MELVKGGVSVDDRGDVRFVNDFNFMDVNRFYHIRNHKVGFVRAWHCHINEAKWFYVARGTARVGVAKLQYLDPAGPLDGYHYLAEPKEFILSDRSPQILHIPAGHGNGVQFLEPNSDLIVYSDMSLKDSLNDCFTLPYDKFPNFWKDRYR